MENMSLLLLFATPLSSHRMLWGRENVPRLNMNREECTYFKYVNSCTCTDLNT